MAVTDNGSGTAPPEPRRHTIFLLQGKSVQQRTVELLTGWSAAGLVQTASFLDLDAPAGPAGPGEWDHTIVREAEHFVLSDGELGSPVLVLDWLADNFCDVIRLVALHTAEQPGAEADGVRKAELIRQGLQHYRGVRQMVVPISCFLVDEELTKLDAESVLPTWSANLVISPTDQALPDGSATPIRAQLSDGKPDPRYAAVAAQALCTIGGVWSFMGEGPFDHNRTDSVAAGCRVIRTFVRTLDLPDPTPRITHRVLEPLGGSAGLAGTWPDPQGRPYVPAIPAISFSQEAAQQLCERYSRTVNLRELPAAVVPEPTPVGFWTAVRMFFQFMVRGFVTLPRIFADTIVERASRAASSMATNRLFGEQSGYLVEVGPRRSLPPVSGESAQTAMETAARLVSPNDTYMPPATRDLLGELLRIGTALLDGGDMPPEQVPPRIGDVSAFIPDPSDIAVAPSHPTLTIPGSLVGQEEDVVLRGHDPLTAVRIRELLQAECRQLAADDGQSARADATSPGSGDGTPQPDDEAADESAASDDTASVSRRLSNTADQISRIDSWIAGTRRPFTWLVGERIALPLTVAQMRAYSAASRLGERPEIQQVRIPDRLSALRALGIAALLSLCTWAVTPLGVWKWRTALFLSIALLLTGALVAYRQFYRRLKQEFQILHRQEVEIEELNRAARELQHYSFEALRLGSLYWQYERWAAVLAGALHRPFGSIADTEAAVDEPRLISDGPRSARSATAIPDPQLVERLCNLARRRVYTQGWNYRALQAGISSLTEQLGKERSLAPEARLDPFDDNDRQNSGTLERLQHAYRHGAHGVAARAEPNRRTADLTSNSPMQQLTSEVLVKGTDRYPDAAAPPDADPTDGFIQELFPSPHEQSFPVSLWQDAGLRAPADVEERIIICQDSLHDASVPQTRFLPAAAVRNGKRLLFAAARLDLSYACPPEALVLFERRSQADRWPLEIFTNPHGGD